MIYLHIAELALIIFAFWLIKQNARSILVNTQTTQVLIGLIKQMNEGRKEGSEEVRKEERK